MNKVKFYQNKNIKLNGVMYKPYFVGNQDGITQWFNYKGFTYIEKKDNIWNYL